MAEKNNATCSICGKAYHKCLSCKNEASLKPWKTYCCSSEHFKIFQVIRGFNTGVYTKDEAKEKLQAIDLSDLNKLRDNIKKQIKDIIKEDKKVEKIKSSEVTTEDMAETTEETVIPMTETVTDEVVEESVVKPHFSSYISRKKKPFEQEGSE